MGPFQVVFFLTPSIHGLFLGLINGGGVRSPLNHPLGAHPPDVVPRPPTAGNMSFPEEKQGVSLNLQGKSIEISIYIFLCIYIYAQNLYIDAVILYLYVYLFFGFDSNGT